MNPLRPTVLAVLLGIALSMPAGLAAPAPLSPAEVVAPALELAAQGQALASAFPQGAGLADQLARAAALDLAATVAAPEPASFADALADLYAAAGLPAPLATDAPEPALAAALAPVVQALADQARLQGEAFADLTPEERAWLLANTHATLAPVPGAAADDAATRVHELAARVDQAKILEGALLVAAALDDFQAPPMALTWSDPQGLIEVGSTSNDAYATPRVLIVDLGGNDTYDNEPATYRTGSSLALPASVILDLGGDDTYTVPKGGTVASYGMGVGIGGIGLLVDRWGDDSYKASIQDTNPDCPADFYEGNAQLLYTQGVGAYGVGAVLDTSGNDVYDAYNINSVFNYCHFGWVFTFAQGVGLNAGVGLLVDDTGNDVYAATSESYGKADNVAVVFAQGAAAGGIGFLVDKEGSDSYRAQTVATMTVNYVKGAFAYTFAQASVAATRRQPVAPEVVPGVVTPALPTDILCPGNRAAARCDLPGVAVLVDVLGDDSFSLYANAEDRGAGCGWGAIAVASGQGSAAWNGLAMLVNLDVEGTDSFLNAPFAKAIGCSVLGVRALSYGQGYGGSLYWNFWDAPTPRPDAVAVGILVSAGALSPCAHYADTGQDALPPSGLPVKPAVRVCTLGAAEGIAFPQLTASRDVYTAKPTAHQTMTWACASESCIGAAESWVQGSTGSGTLVLGTPYGARGAGVHVDVGGDDAYQADSTADGLVVRALVLGQGGAVGNLALLANVGGHDAYSANTWENGALNLAGTRVQGWAEGATPISAGGECLGLIVAVLCLNPINASVGSAIGVFVDVLGWDTYSEAAERSGCHGNGTFLGTWPVGAPLGPMWWGSVVGHPCATPTPDIGTGTVIGLDWLSDVDA